MDVGVPTEPPGLAPGGGQSFPAEVCTLGATSTLLPTLSGQKRTSDPPWVPVKAAPKAREGVLL